MAVIQGGNVRLSASQTGNGDSTNTLALDKPSGKGGAVIITTVIGATPTVTINILGSVDGIDYYNVPYAREAAPETLATAALVYTTAQTETIILRKDQPWRFLKLALSANTNVTVTADAIA